MNAIFQDKDAKTQRGEAATKRKRLQRRDAKDAESRRGFSLTTNGHGFTRIGKQGAQCLIRMNCANYRELNSRLAFIRNPILQLRARTPKIWTAVAERSGDTAFRMTKGYQKRRGASLPAAVQNLWLRLLPRWVYPCPSVVKNFLRKDRCHEIALQRCREPSMAVGSTRLRRVQFGVPPNCLGMRAIYVARATNDKPCLQKVSGATPETTRGTRVLHHFSWCPGVLVVQNNQQCPF
jgi:hypothetical protein